MGIAEGHSRGSGKGLDWILEIPPMVLAAGKFLFRDDD